MSAVLLGISVVSLVVGSCWLAGIPAFTLVAVAILAGLLSLHARSRSQECPGARPQQWRDQEGLVDLG